MWKWIWRRGEANKFEFDRVEWEDSGGPGALEPCHEVPGQGLEAAEKHTVAEGLDILEATMEQVAANEHLWMQPAAEAVQTPTKKKAPQGVQLDTPPAEEMKRKRGRPRKADPCNKVQRVPASEMQEKLQPTLGRFFKSDPSAEDLKFVQVQAMNSRHKPSSGPNAAEVAEVQMVRAETGAASSMQKVVASIVEDTAARAALDGRRGGLLGGRPKKDPADLRGVLGGGTSNRLQRGQTCRRFEIDAWTGLAMCRWMENKRKAVAAENEFKKACCSHYNRGWNQLKTILKKGVQWYLDKVDLPQKFRITAPRA